VKGHGFSRATMYYRYGTLSLLTTAPRLRRGVSVCISGLPAMVKIRFSIPRPKT